MNKKLLLGVVVCGVLLLTGCGDSGAKTLKCTQKNDQIKEEIVIDFDSDEKIEKISVKQEFYLPEGTSEANAVAYKLAFEEECKKLANCSVSVKDNTVYINYSGAPSEVGYSEIAAKSYDEIKEDLATSDTACE